MNIDEFVKVTSKVFANYFLVIRVYELFCVRNIEKEGILKNRPCEGVVRKESHSKLDQRGRMTVQVTC